MEESPGPNDAFVATSETSAPEFIDTHAPPQLAFDDFYAANVESVARALGLTLGDHELGLEAADEAFTRAFSKWSQVSRYDNPAGWTYRVGLNWARSWLRRKARAFARRHAIAELHGVSVLDTVEIPNHVEDLELRNALLALSHEHRSVVVLRYFLDWSTEQTAEALDLAPGTVKSRLSRGLDQLRNSLTEPTGSSTTSTSELDQ